MKKYTYSSILKRLQTEKRVPYLFIGAGFTRRYIKNSFGWRELLDNLAELIGIDKFIINNLRIKYEKTDTDGVVNQKIATFLSDELHKKISSNNYSKIFDKNDIDILNRNNYDAFKYLISKLTSINKIPNALNFRNEKYKLTELKYFKQLKENIPAIFTTNYDQLLELLFKNEYISFTKQSDYFYNENYNFAEIYKIHGSVSDPNSIIITKEDYDDFTKKNYLTTSKLLQVLSSNPIIFIGYSMQDEDINQIINNLLSCLDGEKLKILENNIVFISWKEHLKYFIETKKEFKFGNKTINIKVIETDNYSQLFNELLQFKPYASPLEIRKYKQMISGLINSNDKKLNYVFANLDVNATKIEENEKYISAVANSPKASEKYTNEDIIRNYLFSKTKYAREEIQNWTQSFFNANRWIPLYYYLDVEKEPTLNGFKNKKEEQIRKLTNKLSKYKGINHIDEINLTDPKKSNVLNILIKSLLRQSLNYKEVKQTIKKLYNENEEIIKLTEFKICVTLISKFEKEEKNKVNK